MPFNIFCCLPVVKSTLLSKKRRKKKDYVYFESFSFTSIDIFPVWVKTKRKKLWLLILTFILDTILKHTELLEWIWYIFIFLLVHFGGKCMFWLSLLLLCTESCTICRNHDGCFVFVFFSGESHSFKWQKTIWELFLTNTQRELVCSALKSSNLNCLKHKHTHAKCFGNVDLFATRPNTWSIRFRPGSFFWISPEGKDGPSYTETPFSASRLYTWNVLDIFYSASVYICTYRLDVFCCQMFNRSQMFGPMRCLYGTMLFVLFLVNVQRISLRRW